MNFRCIFGHKYEVIRRIKQKLVDEDNSHIGFDVYLIKKCERCSAEYGQKIDYFWQQPKHISVEYIRTVYGYDPK